MRRLVLGAAVVASLLGAPPAAGAEVRAKCAAAGSRTAAKTQALRVYWGTLPSERDSGEDRALLGCLRQSGRTRALFRLATPAPNTSTSLILVRAAGVRTAFVASSFCTVCGTAGPFSSIYEFDVRTGRRRALRNPRGPSAKGQPGTGIDALAIDACGRVAYRSVARGIFTPPDPDPRLNLWTPGTPPVLYDSGKIGPRSIRLTRHTLVWTKDGEEETAALEACNR